MDILLSRQKETRMFSRQRRKNPYSTKTWWNSWPYTIEQNHISIFVYWIDVNWTPDEMKVWRKKIKYFDYSKQSGN